MCRRTITSSVPRLGPQPDPRLVQPVAEKRRQGHLARRGEPATIAPGLLLRVRNFAATSERVLP